MMVKVKAILPKTTIKRESLEETSEPMVHDTIPNYLKIKIFTNTSHYADTALWQIQTYL